MLRPTVLSIVFLVAAGSSASVLCEAWCYSDTAGAEQCVHDKNSGLPIAAAGTLCVDALQVSAILPKEDRRHTSIDVGGAVSTLGPVQLVVATGLKAPENHGRQPSDLSRPLVLPLRI